MPFLATHLQVRPSDGVSITLDGSNSHRDVPPFYDIVDIATNFGVKPPKTPNYGDMNQHFGAKRAKY